MKTYCWVFFVCCILNVMISLAGLGRNDYPRKIMISSTADVVRVVFHGALGVWGMVILGLI